MVGQASAGLRNRWGNDFEQTARFVILRIARDGRQLGLPTAECDVPAPKANLVGQCEPVVAGHNQSTIGGPSGAERHYEAGAAVCQSIEMKYGGAQAV